MARRTTEAYAAKLAEVGQGSWRPRTSAVPWVRFSLKARYQQADTLIRRNIDVGAIWLALEKVRKDLGLPERCETPLMDATFGDKLRNQRYRDVGEISDVVAS